MTSGDLTQGRPAADAKDFFNGEADEQGIWWKRLVKPTPNAKSDQPYVMWLTRHPGAGHHGRLREGHQVTEHEDGTITVTPSIQCRVCGWHGYLERGVWREVE